MVPADTPQRDEHGFSLVESVIAVAVLGIIVSAMVGGMGTSIAMSSLHRQQSGANAVMVSATEAVKSASYTRCASTYPTGTLPSDWPSGPWINVVVQYWNPTTSTFESTPCHDNDGSEGLFPMQLVTILVIHPGTGITSPCPQLPMLTSTTCVSIVKRGP